MTQERWDEERGDVMSRRMLMKTIGVAAGAAIVMPRVAIAQAPASGPGAPPSTVTNPPRDLPLLVPFTRVRHHDDPSCSR